MVGSLYIKSFVIGMIDGQMNGKDTAIDTLIEQMAMDVC